MNKIATAGKLKKNVIKENSFKKFIFARKKFFLPARSSYGKFTIILDKTKLIFSSSKFNFPKSQSGT